ncbi:hypothetical protein L218DRAFT_951516 [Marasmius fiardii PR-910]|nr:hypothetical protein L218DRAFT_951516 [Marasmius fiardii PR-910]
MFTSDTIDAGIGRCWDDTYYTQKESLIKFMSRHLTHALLPPTVVHPEPQHSLLPSDASLFTITTSDTSIFISPDSPRGLQFLIFLNNKLAKDTEFHNLESAEDTTNEWADALERLRILLQLPPGFFMPILRQHDGSSLDVLDHTMPRDTMGSITDRTIVGESAISRHFLGSGNSVLREEEMRSRDGSSASCIFEGDWEYSEMAGLATALTAPRDGDERGEHYGTKMYIVMHVAWLSESDEKRIEYLAEMVLQWGRSQVMQVTPWCNGQLSRLQQVVLSDPEQVDK